MGNITRLASRVYDGMQNLVANLGTDRDKAAHSFYAPPALTVDQAINAYRGSWLPRRIVDIPAFDACRKWRSWQADADQITAIEAEERRLNLREKTLQAVAMARLYGGSALFIGTGAARPDEPFDPEEIGRGGLRYVTMLTQRQLTALAPDDNVESEFFGLPTAYDLTFRRGSAPVRIHPSRLTLFTGAHLPDPEVATGMQVGWGESVLVATMDAIRHADATAANVASLVFEAKVDVVRIPNLMENLATDPRFESLVIQRATLAATGKGINGMLILDKEEEYEQKSANFSTLPDIMDRFYQAVSGAAEIPVSRLFGRSAAGMNATGDGDERVYFDRVQAIQELEIAPAIARLDEALIRSALGARPPELHFVWVPLRQKTEVEVAGIGKTIAETGKAMKESALFPEEVLAKAVSNALIEAGALPGLEAAIDEFGLALDEPDEDDEASAMPERPGLRLVGADAEPRPLYVRRDVLNGAEIAAWAKSQGFETTVPDMHITIAFSRQPVDWMKAGAEWADSPDGKMTIAAGGPRMMERFGDAIVLLVASSRLSWRHEEIKQVGASWDHPEYNPHVTITYAAPDGLDLSKVEPFRGAIELGPEIFEPLDEDWKSGISET